jgi:lipopolysaccharide biosynthesis regulator YciM
MLQSIPAKSRTVRTNMALGKLYMQTGMERAAITSFKEVLRVSGFNYINKLQEGNFVIIW